MILGLNSWSTFLCIRRGDDDNRVCAWLHQDRVCVVGFTEFVLGCARKGSVLPWIVTGFWVANVGVDRCSDPGSKNSGGNTGFPAPLRDNGMGKPNSHVRYSTVSQYTSPCQISQLFSWTLTQGCQRVFLGMTKLPW